MNTMDELISVGALKKVTILDEAKNLIYNDREKEYGHPSDNFGRIATMWAAYLNVEITPRDVCIMMTLLKLAREGSGMGKRDNIVDAAGYLGLVERVEEKK